MELISTARLAKPLSWTKSMTPERRRENGVGREERRRSVHRRQFLEMTVGARFQGVQPPAPKAMTTPPRCLSSPSPPPFLSPPPLPVEVGPLKSS